MRKHPMVHLYVLLTLLLSLLGGCAGKGKDVKTIKGDPAVLYRQGLERFNKRDYSEALKIFEQIKSNFPDSPPYTQWAEIKVGDCHFFNKDYVEAIAAYEEFKKTRPTHEDIPYVQYQIGMSHFQQMRTHDRDQTATQKALSNFEYLVANTPPSLFTEKAAEKIEVCKKRLADHEFYIGQFYYKQGRYQAAASRFEGVLQKFPKRTQEDQTLYFLGKSLIELDQWEKASEAFLRIVNEYPKSPHYKEARSILDQGRKDVRKTQTKESKKRAATTGRESEKIALARFDEERRRPVLFKDEREVSPPADVKPSSPVPPEAPVEENRVAASPLIRYEEEKRQPLSPPSPPLVEVKVEAKPDDEKRMVALSPSPATPKPGEKEEGVGWKEGEKVKEKEASIKEIPAGLKEIRPGEPGEPIDITSDRVEAFSKENLIVFKGNVTARQKDIVIYADSLEAMIFEDGKGIEKVVAGGNVKIQQGLRIAHCQKAVFYNRDQKVVLTGDPRVWEGDNQISGEEIVFDIARNRVEVKGGPKERGKVRVIPGEGLEKLK